MSAIVSDSNKVFTVANNAAFYGNSFTASIWYKLTSDPNDFAYAFANQTSSAGWELFSSQGTSPNDLKPVSEVFASVAYSANDPTARTLNTWNFIVITFDSTNNQIKLYWGNETTSPALIATTTTVGTMATDVSTSLGFGTNPADSTNIRAQRISDARIYNATVRTLSAIQSDYLQRLVGTETGLTDYWKFNETSGNTATNSTSARNATATAASWATTDDPAFTAGTTTSTSTSTSTSTTSTSTSTTSTSTSTTSTSTSTSTTSTSTSTTSTSTSTTSTSTTQTTSSTSTSSTTSTSSSTTTTLPYIFSVEGAT